MNFTTLIILIFTAILAMGSVSKELIQQTEKYLVRKKRLQILYSIS